MRDQSPLPEHGFTVNWSKLNNELFGLIYADPQLRARYDRATFEEANEICAELFDALVHDVTDFVERYVVT